MQLLLSEALSLNQCNLSYAQAEVRARRVMR
jgi:hypothetical protein